MIYASLGFIMLIYTWGNMPYSKEKDWLDWLFVAMCGAIWPFTLIVEILNYHNNKRVE
jgi:hypothetical protein